MASIYTAETVRFRLQRLAQIITKSDCLVRIARSGASTDGKDIYIDPSLAGYDSPAKMWIRLLAILHHESWHCLWTDFKARKGMILSLPARLQPLGAIVSNILEDGRIELYGSLDRPGARLWIKFSNEEIWNKREATGDIRKDLLMSLAFRAILDKDLKGLAPEFAEILDSIQELIDRGVTSASCRECMDCSAEITRIISKYLLDPEMPDYGKPGEFSQTEGKEVSEELAKRAKEKRKKKTSKHDKSEESDNKETTEGAETKTEESAAPKSNKKEDSENNERTDKSSDTEASEEGHAETEGLSEEEEPPEELPETKEPSNKEKPFWAESPPEPPGTECSPESEPSEDECTEDSSEDSTEEEPAEPSKASTEREEESDGIDDSPDDGAAEDFEEPSDDDFEGDTSEDETDDISLDDDIVEPEDSDSGMGERLGEENETSESLKSPGDSYSAPDDSVADFEAEDDEEDGLSEEELTRLLEDAEKEIDELLALDDLPKPKYEEIPLGDIHRRMVFQQLDVPSKPAEYQKLRANIMPHAQRMARLLKPLFAPRREDSISAQKRGTLDPVEVWRLPKLSDSSVFERRNQPSKRLDVSVFFLIDQSGSMGCGFKYLHAQVSTAILAESFNLLKVPFASVAFTASGTLITHKRIIEWGSDDYTRIPSIRAGGDNRDGYSIRKSANELLKRKEKIRILFVLSDGEPAHAYDSYLGNRGVNDTRLAVKEATRRGLIVQGLLVSDSHTDQEAARFIYPNLLIVDDYSRLPDQLTYKMRQLLSKFK